MNSSLVSIADHRVRLTVRTRNCSAPGAIKGSRTVRKSAFWAMNNSGRYAVDRAGDRANVTWCRATAATHDVDETAPGELSDRRLPTPTELPLHRTRRTGHRTQDRRWPRPWRRHCGKGGKPQKPARFLSLLFCLSFPFQESASPA